MYTIDAELDIHNLEDVGLSTTSNAYANLPTDLSAYSLTTDVLNFFGVVHGSGSSRVVYNVMPFTLTLDEVTDDYVSLKLDMKASKVGKLDSYETFRDIDDTNTIQGYNKILNNLGIWGYYRNTNVYAVDSPIRQHIKNNNYILLIM